MKKNKHYEENDKVNEQINYWRNELSFPLVNTSFPICSCIQEGKVGVISHINFNIAQETSEKIMAMTNKSEVGTYIILLSAVQYILSVYCGSEDVATGVPTYGGKVSIYPFKTHLNHNDNFKEFLVKIKTKFMEISKKSTLSYEETYKELGFDNIEKNFIDTIILDQNLHKSFITNNLKSKMIFIFNIRQEIIELKIQYDNSLYTEDIIQGIGDHLLMYLKSVTQNTSIELSDIEILPEDEKHKVLVQFNSTEKKYDLSKTIHKFFEEQVEKIPESIAIVCEDKQLTYKELNEKSNQIAVFLRKSGVKQNDIVGLMVERTINMVVGMLAILKAGGAYLPIDTKYPTERIQYMLEDSGSNLLLTFSHLKDKAMFNKTIVEMDNEKIYKESSYNLLNMNDSKDLAYVLYTSGSTGKPKGVLIEHRSVNNLVHALTEKIDFSSNQTILAITNITFDMSITETLLSLAMGLKVIIANDIQVNDAKELCKLISDFNIDIVQFTPSRMMLFLEYKDVALYLNKVKSILVGGESFSEKLLKKIKSITEGRIYNIYGPTEITVYATLRELTYTDKINIGKPLANVRAYILNKYGKPQPLGVLGELYISGEGVARGYLNKDDLTKDRFIYNPSIPGERLYKTGDIARWTIDGNIEYIGRIDNQVKIRGFRIELGDIENQLLNIKFIKKAVVIVKTDELEQKYLCGFIVSDKEFTVFELSEFLKQKLPSYMIPSKFVQIDEMPLNLSGKTDRKMLEKIDGRMEMGFDDEEAQSETQEKLCRIWETLLNIDKVSINEDFFIIGGHSLNAARLISSIYKEFGVELSLSDIFKFSTIKQLARHIDSSKKNHYCNICVAPKAPYYATTTEQKRIYAAHQVDDIGTSYNVPVFMKIEGKLDTDKLQYSFEKLIDRHESLRTFFKYEEGDLVQIISDNVEFNVSIEEFNEYKIEERLQKFIKPFDLAKAPLIRVTIGKIKEDKYVLMMDIHHIVVDGVSISRIFYELGKLYEGEDIADLNFQYKDYSAWQRQMLKTSWNKKQEEYWMDILKGEIPVMNMQMDYSAVVKNSFEGNHIKFTLDCEITKAIRNICKAEGVTVYMVLLAAYNILLSKYTAQEDVIIGIPVSGRVHPDLEPIVGMFVNSLPMRNYPSGDKTFKDFLLEVKNNTINAFDNQGYQLEHLIERLNIKRTNNGNLLFNTMFVLKNYDAFQLDIKEMKSKEYSLYGNTALFDIVLEIEEKEKEMECVFQYRTRIFKDETIERMSQHFNSILKCVIRANEVKISEIEIITDEEKNKILYEFNETDEKYSKDKIIHELFEEQVQKTPDNIAVIFEDKQLTYRELNEKANSLARILRDKGVKADSIVGIMVERSIEMIIGIMGSLKAGGAYLPVDPSYPKERIEYMLKDSESKVLLSEGNLLDNIEFNGEIVDLSNEELFNGDSNNIVKINNFSDLAYIIYTSGTTGIPKGVAIEHYSILNTVSWRKKYYNFNERDVVLQIPSFSFDSSVEDILTTLISGGKLVVINQDKRLDINYLKETILKNNVTNFLVTPAFYNTLLDNCLLDIKTLKKVTVAGENIPQKIVRKHFKFLKNVRLFNEYGPTENSVCSTIYEFNNKRSEVLIGKPIANKKIYILDKSRNIIPIGVAGEVYISGVGLARGYLNQPELTAEKFLENPFEFGTKMYKTGDLARWRADGNIEFLGRIDNQVKIRGFRMELGEIENRLLQNKDIQEAVVVVKDNKNNEKYICAYVVCDKEIADLNLKDYLKESLPEYMLPSYFMQLEKISLTPNGKIDIKSLPEPNKAIIINEYEAPRNEVEEKLSKIWSKILGIEKVGINSSFFDLGGYSIKAIELVSIIQKEFKLLVSLSIVFKKQTIKEIGNYINNEIKNIYPPIELVESKDYYPASPAQRRMFILNQLYPDNVGYNVSDVQIVEGKLSIDKVEKAFKEIIKRHESLRTSFDIVDGEIIQKIHTSVSFKLQYIDSCGKDERELIKENINPFNLKESPLIRIKLIKLDSNKHMLIIDTHHIISDGISMEIITKEFEDLYGGGVLPDLKLQYKDYSVWQEKLLKSQLIEKQKNYWMDIYKKNIPKLNMPKEYSLNNLYNSSGEFLKFKGDSDLTYKLKELSQRLGVNIFSILLAAYKILLAKVANQEDIIVGIPVSGRHYMGTKNIIGMFVNTLAIRSYPKCHKSINEFINEVYNSTLDAYDNQDYQFDELVDNLKIEREYGKNALFDTMFSLFDGHAIIPKIQDLTFKQLFIPEEDCLFDISLDGLVSSDEIVFVYQYNKSMFRKESIEKYANGYINILNCMVEDGDSELKEIEFFGLNHL